MSLVIYSAIYRDNVKGKCLKAGVAFRIKVMKDGKSHQKDFETISTDRTYGDLWLSELIKLVGFVERYASMPANERDGAVERITLVISQIDTGKMAKKVERILCDALARKVKSEEEVAKLVFKDGRYTKRPNNHLYTKVVWSLYQLHTKHAVRFVQHHLPSRHTMDLVKALHQQIAPHKVLINKTKPKKKNAPL